MKIKIWFVLIILIASWVLGASSIVATDYYKRYLFVSKSLESTIKLSNLIIQLGSITLDLGLQTDPNIGLLKTELSTYTNSVSQVQINIINQYNQTPSKLTSQILKLQINQLKNNQKHLKLLDKKLSLNSCLGDKIQQINDQILSLSTKVPKPYSSQAVAEIEASFTEIIGILDNLKSLNKGIIICYGQAGGLFINAESQSKFIEFNQTIRYLKQVYSRILENLKTANRTELTNILEEFKGFSFDKFAFLSGDFQTNLYNQMTTTIDTKQTKLSESNAKLETILNTVYTELKTPY
jgi:hypothetical protein